MKKGLFILVGIVMLMTACGNDDSSTTKKEAPASQEKAGDVEVNYDDFIGVNIDVSEDDSITLPFETLVIDAVYSEDGHFKLLKTPDEVILIDGEEIVHIEETTTTFNLPAISKDGKFAAWYPDYSDGIISVYDFENSGYDAIESEEGFVELGMGNFTIIEKHGDSYYYMDNMYYEGPSPYSAIDITTKERYIDSNEDDVDTLKMLEPEVFVFDDDRWHEYTAQARVLLEPISEQWNYYFEDAGYYQLFYHYERDSEEDTMQYMTSLYGFNANESSDVPFEISTDAFSLGEKATQIREDDVRIADETGLAYIPMYDHISDDTYNLSVYYIDLSVSNPELSLVTEEEIEIKYRKRPRGVFNADRDGFYLTHMDGTMTHFDLKN